ncbi:MAG TPA: DNA repair protein [Clostridia bacterium]|nr:DNA repair protein [Clostridia bacterium]
MEAKQRTYYCIDMKSFFASVECAERGLNPFETNLVVADESRGRGALCLAVTPKMKSLGVKNRCRIFEIPKDIEYIVAKPRMKKYIDYAADIYEIYLKYIRPEEIHVYSIDEDFIDATDYLRLYKLDAKQFAKKLINEIADTLHIPATAGIGTNLYLAKIALDITAKKVPDHIGYLDEELYREQLWDHRPITDFWQVAKGTANRLARYGIFDMRGIANAPEDLIYKLFGINAEILIDHAWGRESCTMEDIKNYKSQTKSLSNSQILFEDYSFEKAKVVMMEMALNGCQRMMREHVITNHVGCGVGYSKDLAEPTGGAVRMTETTAVYSIVGKYIERIFEETTHKDVPIRRLWIWFDVCGEGCEGYDLFTNFEAVEKEKKVERAVLNIKDRFGKNAMLRALDLQDGATAIIRNKLIGGHNGE